MVRTNASHAEDLGLEVLIILKNSTLHMLHNGIDERYAKKLHVISVRIELTTR